MIGKDLTAGSNLMRTKTVVAKIPQSPNSSCRNKYCSNINRTVEYQFLDRS